MGAAGGGGWMEHDGAEEAGEKGGSGSETEDLKILEALCQVYINIED